MYITNSSKHTELEKNLTYPNKKIRSLSKPRSAEIIFVPRSHVKNMNIWKGSKFHDYFNTETIWFKGRKKNSWPCLTTLNLCMGFYKSMSETTVYISSKWDPYHINENSYHYLSRLKYDFSGYIRE